MVLVMVLCLLGGKFDLISDKSFDVVGCSCTDNGGECVCVNGECQCKDCPTRSPSTPIPAEIINKAKAYDYLREGLIDLQSRKQIRDTWTAGVVLENARRIAEHGDTHPLLSKQQAVVEQKTIIQQVHAPAVYGDCPSCRRFR